MGIDYLDFTLRIEKRFGIEITLDDAIPGSTVKDFSEVLLQHINNEKIDPTNVRCKSCEYLLRGLDGSNCPECGRAIVKQKIDLPTYVLGELIIVLSEVTGIDQDRIHPEQDLFKDLLAD